MYSSDQLARTFGESSTLNFQTTTTSFLPYKPATRPKHRSNPQLHSSTQSMVMMTKAEIRGRRPPWSETAQEHKPQWYAPKKMLSLESSPNLRLRSRRRIICIPSCPKSLETRIFPSCQIISPSMLAHQDHVDPQADPPKRIL